MLCVEDITCRGSDFFNGVNPFHQVFDYDFAAFVRQVLADGVVLRPCDFEFRTRKRFFCLAVYLLDFKNRVLCIRKYKRLCFAPFQRNILMVVRVDAVALRCFDFLHGVNSFVQVAD